MENNNENNEEIPKRDDKQACYLLGGLCVLLLGGTIGLAVLNKNKSEEISGLNTQVTELAAERDLIRAEAAELKINFDKLTILATELKTETETLKKQHEELSLAFTQLKNNHDVLIEQHTTLLEEANKKRGLFSIFRKKDNNEQVPKVEKPKEVEKEQPAAEKPKKQKMKLGEAVGKILPWNWGIFKKKK